MKKNKIKLICFIIVAIIILCTLYIDYNTKATNIDKSIGFIINENDTYYSIANRLYEEKLIRNVQVYKLYIKIKNPKSLEKGSYKLHGYMNLEEIINNLSSKAINIDEEIRITFKEGLNMRKIAKLIEENTNNSYDDVMNTLKDKKYIESLTNKYWFITKDILNENIYFPLEGYLFPDTYNFVSKNVLVTDIFEKLLDEMDTKLTPYKDDINNSNLSIHELITLASIVELEGANSDDRSGIAGVFYNRLDDGWTLGSDVTTYYGIQVDLSDRDLYIKELEACNSYNTRAANCLVGKLPVSPICNPSLESIKASINYKKHDYYYFVADKYGKTYFNKTSNQHDRIITELKDKGLWHTY